MEVDNELRHKRHILQWHTKQSTPMASCWAHARIFNHLRSRVQNGYSRWWETREKSKLGRGIRVRSQSKEVIYNVHKYFERLNKKRRTKAPVKRASELSEATRLEKLLCDLYWRREHLSRQLRGIRDQGKRLLMILMKREFKKPFMLCMAGQNDLTSLS